MVTAVGKVFEPALLSDAIRRTISAELDGAELTAEEFAFGLGCLLDGVESRLPQAPARRNRSRNKNSPS